MFRPAAMRHVLIEALRDDLPQVSLVLARSGAFQPDYRLSDEHTLTHVPGEHYRQIYREAAARLDKLCADLPTPLPEADRDWHIPDQAELAALNDRLGELWAACSECLEQLRKLDEESHLVDQLEVTLANFASLNVDLGLLQGERQFLALRIGTLPRDNLAHLREALGLAGFLVYSFLLSGSQAHVVIVGPKNEHVEHVASVLESAGFHDMPIPAELRDQPDVVARQLAERRRRIADERAALQEKIADQAARHRDFLAEARRRLALAEPYVELGSAAHSSERMAVIGGWVPAEAVDELSRSLNREVSGPVRLIARRPRPAELPLVPTLLSPGRLLSPFTSLVTQYGVPRYGEIDPSAVFAVTFILMFGMMFGDLGQGAVIALGALALRRRLKRFTAFGVLAGVSSMVFGAVYGSVFGMEELVHPLWQSPLHDPVLMLKVALGWGIGFLLLMTAMSIHNKLIEGDWQDALLGVHGAVSITLYAGLLWAGWQLYDGQSVGAAPGLLIGLSLLALAGHKWRASQAPPAERLMVVLVETFETITGNLSATLSFLRVAAFSLNHVALAIAVFTLADMLDPVGHGLMVVFGNLFILVLEGAIVVIQALRLEYYEGFTRFYAGDGHAFRPLRWRPPGSNAGNASQPQGVSA